LDKFLQTLMDALAVGSLYALIALGYTMVYGILKFINFAHSDVFVLGAWVSFSAAIAADWPPPSGWVEEGHLAPGKLMFNKTQTRARKRLSPTITATLAPGRARQRRRADCSFTSLFALCASPAGSG